jgi:hypothetical protein
LANCLIFVRRSERRLLSKSEGETQEAQALTQPLLGVMLLITTAAFLFRDFNDPENGAQCELKLTTIVSDTLVHIVAAWNGEGDIGLTLIDVDGHCVTQVGQDMSNKDFNSCALPTRGTYMYTYIGHTNPSYHLDGTDILAWPQARWSSDGRCWPSKRSPTRR